MPIRLPQCVIPKAVFEEEPAFSPTPNVGAEPPHPRKVLQDSFTCRTESLPVRAYPQERT